MLPSAIRVAEKFDDDGYAIYTTNLQAILDGLDADRSFEMDIYLQRLAADWSAETNWNVLAGRCHEHGVLCDAFCHSELIEELDWQELGVERVDFFSSDDPEEHPLFPYVKHAAEVFHNSTPPPYGDMVTPSELIDSFFRDL